MSNTRKECIKCGGTDIGYGKQAGYAVISPNGKMGFGSSVMHVICTDCGYVLESYVEKPKRFKGTDQY